MYSAIQELFYGSYSASDLPTSNVPGYRESLRHTIELSEQLRAGHALMGKAYFAQGFSLGVRLLLEALHAPRPG